MEYKQYTTEEITRRLKAGESVTYIGEPRLDITKFKKYYPVRMSNFRFFLNNDANDEYYYFFTEFNNSFMFTSDYEAMKSEEAKDTLKQSDLHDAPTDTPEWLQRERVMFWVNAFIASKGQTTFDCSNYADKCLEQFDKRFLNQKETK